jgi:hypothetical protein
MLISLARSLARFVADDAFERLPALGVEVARIDFQMRSARQHIAIC